MDTIIFENKGEGVVGKCSEELESFFGTVSQKLISFVATLQFALFKSDILALLAMNMFKARPSNQTCIQ